MNNSEYDWVEHENKKKTLEVFNTMNDVQIDNT